MASAREKLGGKKAENQETENKELLTYNIYREKEKAIKCRPHASIQPYQTSQFRDPAMRLNWKIRSPGIEPGTI